MNKMRKLQASALAVACAAGACLAAVTAPQAALAATSCLPTTLIGVHGTGEETGVIGNELASLYNGVAAHTGLPEQGVFGWQDDSALNSDLETGVAAAILGNQAPMAAALAKLQAAVEAGATDLYNQITSEAALCPGEHFVLAGFSQGAAVVAWLAMTHPALAGRVSGAILWADPGFNGNDPLSAGAVVDGPNVNGVNVGYLSTSGWLGVLGDPQRMFPSAWSGLLHSYCTSLDPICHLSLPQFDLSQHGYERFEPILGDSEYLIQGQETGWAPSVWDIDGSNDFYTKWQGLGGASGPLGMPTADAYSDSSGWHQVFQNGHIDNGVVSYNNCNAGRFANGSIDQGILNAYVADGGQASVGCAFDNGGGVFVHYWSGPGANSQDFNGGSIGPAVMVDSPQGTFFVNNGFRTAYISGGSASTCLAPTDNAHDYNGGTRQDFINCYMTWTSAGGVVVHGLNSSTCTSYGGPTITGPNACTGFSIPSSSGTWFSAGGVGLLGQEKWTYANGTVQDSTATYTLSGMDTAHAWQLQAYIPNEHSDSTRAHYHYCSPGGGCADKYLDQQNYTNAWAPIGLVCTSDGTAMVTLSDNGGDNYPDEVGADAINAVRTGYAC
jgi:hypothetical protein